MLNPNKGKICVVFIAVLNIENPQYYENLLSGHDLTNELVRVLIRFRVGPVAFMADMQVTFQTAKVSEKQRSKILRFLWWNDGNLDSEIADYEMSICLFGVVSSPSSSNYALRKTAINNNNCCGSDATTSIMKNFYVDDEL